MKRAPLLICIAAARITVQAKALPDTLVVGAGISGLSAALEAARHLEAYIAHDAEVQTLCAVSGGLGSQYRRPIAS